MAKKRKAGGRAYGDSKAPKDDDSKLAINSWEDVADSEDEFLLNREKVMLDEGPAAKRLRKYQEEGVFLQQRIHVTVTNVQQTNSSRTPKKKS
jgi:U3 small nucleolar RNA-associated protein 3